MVKVKVNLFYHYSVTINGFNHPMVKVKVDGDVQITQIQQFQPPYGES